MEKNQQLLLKCIEMMLKKKTTMRETEDSLMNYIEDRICEKSTTTRATKDSFSRTKMSETKVEQAEASILEIIKESKTSKKIIEHQVKK